jgi:hypothetical protein
VDGSGASTGKPEEREREECTRRQHRLIPGRGHERHRREVVELVRTHFVDEADDRQLIQRSAGLIVTRSRIGWMRQKFGALARRTVPTTS